MLLRLKKFKFSYDPTRFSSITNIEGKGINDGVNKAKVKYVGLIELNANAQFGRKVLHDSLQMKPVEYKNGVLRVI